MSDASGDSRVEHLAESFVARYRRGERPSISEYTRRYPDLAAQIQDVFPALAAIEQAQYDLQEYSPQSAGPAPPAVSTLGDFRIIREIGRGGMGIVYEAEQVTLGRRVALKVLAGSLLNHPTSRKRFTREARATAQLHHTNIVPVFGVGEQDGVAYYVMQLIHGLGLDDVLAEITSDQHEEGSTLPRQLRQPVLAGQATAEFPLCSAGHLADMVLSGQFEQTVLLQGAGDSSSSAGSDQPPADTDMQDQQTALRDTATTGLSGTGPHAFEYALPGQGEATSHAATPQAYWQSVARIGLQVAEALDYKHQQGLCHRDIKPANLLLDMHGTVWVTDFGLAKAADHQNLTQTGDVVGTLRYIAPEQFAGRTDERSDVYSLGLTLYELLALRPAYDQSERQQLLKAVMSDAPPPLRTLNPRLPQDLTTIVHKAIERDPSHRYQSARELADDLQHYLNDEPIRARRISLPARMRRWYRRNPTIAWLTTAIAVLVAATGIGASIAAVEFHELAEEKTKLAGDLTDALSDAETNLTLATSETERAADNLTLALDALDQVYFKGIGAKKLFGSDWADQDTDQSLTPSEKQLLETGLAFYSQLADQNPTNAKSRFEIAKACIRSGTLLSALRGGPKARQSNASAEQLEVAATSFRSGIAHLEELIRDDHTDADVYFELGKAHLALGNLTRWKPDARARFVKARDAYSRAIEIEPDHASALLQRSVAHWLLANENGMIEDAERVVLLTPEDSGLHLNMADYFRTSLVHRDLDRALKHARIAVELAPNSARSRALLGLILFQKGEAERGLEHCNAAVQLDPSDSQAYIFRGAMYRRLGEYQKALDDAETAISIKPHFWAYRRRGEALAALGRIDEALLDYDRALQDNRVDFWSYMDRSTLLVKRGDYAAAIRDLDQASALRPDTAEVLSRRAKAKKVLTETSRAHLTTSIVV